MQIFITGTDTNVGKTLISSWLCLHSQYHYFKPIQTGAIEGRDSDTVYQLTNHLPHPERFLYQAPLSPHASAQLAKEEIDISQIILPKCPNLIIEGAGGVLVPLHQHTLMIDLIKQLAVPVIIVSRAVLGMINHTLLTLESLRARNVPVLGVIINGTTIGKDHSESVEAIASCGNVPILAIFPFLSKIDPQTLASVPLTPSLSSLLGRNFQ